MSRNALIGFLVLGFSGAGLVGFAQVPGKGPPTARAQISSEPSRLPDRFIAQPLAPQLTGPEVGMQATQRLQGQMQITEFGQIADEYATVAAEENASGAPTTAPPNVPAIPLGTKRRPTTFQVPPAAAPVDNGAAEGATSILKKSVAPAIPAALPQQPAPDMVAPPVVPGIGTSIEVYADGERVSARRMARTPIVSESSASDAVVPSIRDMSYRSISPRLRLETRGPQALNLGKESRYYVDLFNEGETDAPEVQVRLVLPASVTVQQLGEGASVQPDAAGQRVLWVVPTVQGRGRATLELSLIATEAKTFELACDWAFRPAGFKASVAVRQPQLQVAVTGPGELGFGEEKSFRVTVSNVGTGEAENVLVVTTATGNREQKLDVGTLSAGSQKEFNVSFVANQPGEMEVKAAAVGDGELAVESASKVLIRRAELVAAMTAPSLKYAGSQAVFAIAIGNAGNTPANDVQMSMTLPAGAKYIGGIDGAQATGNVVKWLAGQIPAGTERLFEPTIELHTAGENRVEVQGRGNGAGVAVATQATTMVEALADLKLVVNDPAGPFPAGDEVTYELTVLNRGSNVAKNLKVLMHFSEGIEPVSVDGAEARLVPGQVLCEPQETLLAGEQFSIRVKAKAATAGNHLFRVEVLCAEPETRLVSEGTTRFIPNNSSERVSTKPTLFGNSK